jgi:hypothetical protein
MPADAYLIGSNPFGGGVSSGTSGVMAYEHSYKGLEACKAYFMLGDAMVCLGADIRLNRAVEVATSVNQCLFKGDLTVSHGEITEPVEANAVNTYTDLHWAHHGNVGYIFPDNADITVKTQRQQGSWSLINSTGSTSAVRNYVFNLAISHGSSPANGQYQYIVAPGRSPEDFRQYAASHGYVTVRNDNTVQAVRNDRLHKAGIVFHAAATVDLGNGWSVTADKPALVLIEREGANCQLSVADPRYSATSVSLTFNKQLSGANAASSGTSTVITVALPTGDYTGSSVTNVYTDVNYTAISQPETDEDEAVIYPNPAGSHATVAFEAGRFSGLEVFGLDGNRLFRKTVFPADTKAEIPVSGWPAGNYIVKLTGDKNPVSKKLIVL